MGGGRDRGEGGIESQPVFWCLQVLSLALSTAEGIPPHCSPWQAQKESGKGKERGNGKEGEGKGRGKGKREEGKGKKGGREREGIRRRGRRKGKEFNVDYGTEREENGREGL